MTASHDKDFRVLHVITGLGGGGAEAALFRLATAMPDPTRVHVVSLTGDGLYASRLRNIGVPVTTLGAGSALSLLRSIPALIRILRSSGADIVQTWMYHADLIGGIAARIGGRPVCWGVRAASFDPTRNKKSTLMVARICARLSRLIPAAVVSPSQAAIVLHRSMGYAGRFELIPNGYDFAALRPDAEAGASFRIATGVPATARVIGHLARADPLKDHPSLLKAFAIVADDRPDVWLLMAGAGLERGEPYLDTLLAGHPFADRIVGVGRRDDIRAVMNAMDVFVLSSAGEAFPNVVAEAMACAVPCVVTDVGDAALIVDGTGWVVPPLAPDRLAQALGVAIDEPSFDRARRGEQARISVLGRFGLDRMAAAYRALWHEIARVRVEASLGT
ncbi:glycosyltransferase [Sphingomonas sp. UV9]|uniref:glycosyltransferase n=1 Tax=Sphingomonas sp. UV9 TaxID=1851410 RepID=UPI000FFC108A|nr:glycosyltransferase [Sphingomonas sp. UV9]RXD02155.1 glycosyltransferase [Sphingomonas sp. UV9]